MAVDLRILSATNRDLDAAPDARAALTTTALIARPLADRALRVKPIEALGYAEAKRRSERNYLIQLLKRTAGNVLDAALLAERNRSATAASTTVCCSGTA